MTLQEKMAMLDNCKSFEWSKILKVNFFNCGYSTKLTCVFLLQNKINMNYQKETLTKYSTDNCFKGTIDNRTLPANSHLWMEGVLKLRVQTLKLKYAYLNLYFDINRKKLQHIRGFTKGEYSLLCHIKQRLCLFY